MAINLSAVEYFITIIYGEGREKRVISFGIVFAKVSGESNEKGEMRWKR